MMKCLDCNAIFDEPRIYSTSWEAYYGVGDLFSNSTYLRLELCCNCGSEDIEEIDDIEEEED